jgi:flavin-dependent dehydrogenase
VDELLCDGFQLAVTPVGGGVAVAALLEPERAIELRCGAARWLAARLDELGLALGPLEAARAIAVGGEARAPLCDGALLVGDAAGAVDPIVGCGISLALESAGAAARAIVAALDGEGPTAHALAPYARELGRLRRHPRLAARLLAAAARAPRWARAAGAILAARPRLGDALLDAIGG